MAYKITTGVPRVGRRIRRPQHPFYLNAYPWQICPFLIAPVIPGETMNNLLLQARTVTDPINDRLIGWWNEYYFFYVKHRDLDDRDELEQMVLDLDWSKANVDITAPVVPHYAFAGASALASIDWVGKCLKRVVETHFRDEGQGWLDYEVGTGLPAAQVSGTNWMHSLVNDADMAALIDVDVDANSDDTITVGEIDAARAQYEFLQANFGMEATYEDFLRSYGVRGKAAEELHRPELLRFVRNWSYPVAAIDPTDGSAAAAVTWSTTERADKNRRFDEPGFIFGVQVTRPKVYFTQGGTVTGHMDDAYSWLPARLVQHVQSSYKNILDNGLLGNVTDSNGTWFDVRDLLLYGEQFISRPASDVGSNPPLVALPTAGAQHRYPQASDVSGLFVGSTASTRLVRTDGLVSLNISSRQEDLTAPT